ncbi:TPA: hypothetical protein I7730_16130 [Vibrio vulnificus]|uniref:Uncharacterized protein n=1 Tax=Vibrio vulnificus TaxID=672 RepID=A0A8H9TG60_VIBVL|nr:hypothetical protein [Vibrio vulnificus]HAS8541312.1 hypothetical protein [Vibrio vulnificus]
MSEQATREDIRLAPWAIEQGFKVKKADNRFSNQFSEYKPGDEIPHNALHFEYKGFSVRPMKKSLRRPKYYNYTAKGHENHSNYFVSLKQCLSYTKSLADKA